MEYRSKYKAEEIEAILDAKNNDGAGVDANLDGLFTDALQTKEVEVSEDTTIKADEGFLGLKEVSVKVSGGGDTPSGGDGMKYMNIQSLVTLSDQRNACGLAYLMKAVVDGATIVAPYYLMNDSLGVMPEITQIHAISYVPSMKVVAPNGSIVEARNIIESLLSAGAIEITEEEFYTL